MNYFDWPELSQSQLKELRRSPAHFRWALDNPRERTPQMALGSALHALVLQPELFADEYVVMPSFDRRTKDGKAAYAAWVAENEGVTPITDEDLTSLQAMKAALLSQPEAAALISGSHPEIELRFELSGVACKAKLDGYYARYGCVFDIKTTQDASPQEFSRSILRFGYHIQAAWYLEAARQNGLDADSFAFLCVESKAPHVGAVYELALDALRRGREEISALLDLYSTCVHTNTWPGYNFAGLLDLPRWAYKMPIGSQYNEE